LQTSQAELPQRSIEVLKSGVWPNLWKTRHGSATSIFTYQAHRNESVSHHFQASELPDDASRDSLLDTLDALDNRPQVKPWQNAPREFVNGTLELATH